MKTIDSNIMKMSGRTNISIRDAYKADIPKWHFCHEYEDIGFNPWLQIASIDLDPIQGEFTMTFETNARAISVPPHFQVYVMVDQLELA